MVKIVFNVEQTKSLSGFLSNMSVAWFVAAFVSPPELFASLRFFIYGILALHISLILLKEIK